MGLGDGQDESGEGGSQAASTGSRKLIDLRDCLSDSPRFRHRLADHESEVVDLETRLEKVVTSCDRMVNNGQAYVEACRSFSSCVRELAGHFHDNSVVEQSLRRFYDTLAEVQSFHSILFDQAQRSVQSALRSFLTGELKKVKDMKKTFHKVSEELNSAINRNAHVPRSKPLEAEEMSSQLANVQTQFSHTAIDYGYHINAVSCNKGHHLLNHLLSYMRAQYTFFHQGYDLLREFDPFMRHVLSQVDNLQKMAEEDITSMNSRHNLVIPQHLKDGSLDVPLRPMDNPAVAIELEGYLFKRSSGAFKTWNRRWFVLRNSQLCYQSESKTEELAVVVEDLRICTFKMADDQERRFCFEVVTPTRSSMLQADSEALRRTWITYLEGGIARALRITASNKKKDEHHELRVRSATLARGRSPTPELSESPILGKKAGSMASLYSLGLDFLDIPGNERCADCGNMNPKWASINLGIMLCIECCGIHRNLGVHISKIRSITLDEWEPEIQVIMCRLGNGRVNAILEYEVPDHVKKPTPVTSRSDREAYIRAKYVLNAFVHPHPDFARPEIPLEPQQPSLQQLFSSTRERQMDSPRITPRSSPASSKRMISPSGIRMYATKPKSYRPLSQSMSSGPDMMQSFDSEDDLLRDFTTSNTPNSSGATSSMALLAENYRKLEKSGKLKNWNITKIKTPRKSSFTQLSGKFSKSYQALNRRFRSDSTKSAKSSMDRDAHSDNEDLENSSATPLLQSKSAIIFLPPSKPPRTFKQRKLDLTGDGDAENALIYEDDDFSGDVLSAIKEMGVVAVLGRDRSSEDSGEEKFTKSVPNGGIQILDSNGDSSSQSSQTSGRISPTPPLLSPRTVSPLASEPPARAFLPPPALSPVHEGAAAQPPAQQKPKEDSTSSVDSLASPASTVGSHQTAVFEEPVEAPALASLPSTTTEPEAELESKPDDACNGDSNVLAPGSKKTQEGAGSLATLSSDGAYPSGYVASEKPFDNNAEDGFTEFQSAAPGIPPRKNPDLPRSASIDELKSPNRVPLSEITSLSFDESKRMSMISVASGDWYSLDEEEGEEDNISNYSAEFPELECAVSYDGPVCPNPIEEEHHLFSTPPSSPPLTAEALRREKERRLASSSERSTSNSPRPKSASPLGHTRRSAAVAMGSLLRRSCSPRPKSASTSSHTPSSQGSMYEEAGEVREDRMGTLRPNHLASPHGKSESDAKTPDSCQEGEVVTKEPPKENHDDPEAVAITNTRGAAEKDSARAEADDQFDDSNETFEDAEEDTTSLEESCEMAASRSAVSVDDSEERRKKSPLKKSQSANTSPSSADICKNTSSASLTRSATDLGLKAKTIPRASLHTRSRSSTLNFPGGTGPRRSLQEAPNRSKDEDYFTKLIKKTDREEKDTASGVAAFSDQDFADILRSSLRGSKVPMVRVESADDGEGASNAGRVESDSKDGERGGEGASEAPCDGGGSPETTAVEPVEPIVIPDSISPDLYLYQSVCIDDLAAILCAKSHGGDINFVNGDDEGKSPMLIAIEKCSTVLVEFLYQNGAKLTVSDGKGRGCLHYAALTDDASVVLLLLKRGARADTLDRYGKDPVQIAVDQENGDIVTLLRVARLKQEEKGNVEDQVAEVYKDFVVAVQVDPERMKRRSQASSDTSSITSRELK